MQTKVKICVTIVEILIGAISYWRIPCAEMNLAGINM